MLLLALLVGCPKPEEPQDTDLTALPDCVATSSNDADADGVSDACDLCLGDDFSGDQDADGTCDDRDPCPNDPADDSDGDGFCDGVDVCDGPDLADADGDGIPCREDCDDADPDARPAASWYRDADGDGFGDPNDVAIRCEPIDGYVTNASDCDDTNNAVSPDAPEWCDGIDTDCNARTSEPTLAVHALTATGWTDLTATFFDGTTPLETTWASTEPTFLGLCGATGPFAFEVAHDVTVRGVGGAGLTARAVPNFTVTTGADVFDPTAHLTLSGVTANALTQPLVLVDNAAADLSDITVSNGQSHDGAVVNVFGGEVTVDGLTATGLIGRAMVANHAFLNVRNSTFSGFYTEQDGGTMLATVSDVMLDDVGVSNSTAARSGGGIAIIDGTVDARDLRMSDCTSYWTGGSLFLTGSHATLDGYESVGGIGYEGAGLYLFRSSAIGSDIDLFGGFGYLDGGGLRMYQSHAVLDDVNLIGGSTLRHGGGAYIGSAEADLTRTVLRGTNWLVLGGDAVAFGGGLHADRADVHLTDVTLRGNESSAGGAMGVAVDARVVLDGSCTITDNKATQSGGTSGALHVSDTSSLLVTSCTFAEGTVNANAPHIASTGNTPFTGLAPVGNLACDVATGCATPTNGADADGDGVHDDLDLCDGDDLADPDANDVPCRIDGIGFVP